MAPEQIQELRDTDGELMSLDEMLAIIKEARMHMAGRLNSPGCREITDGRLAGLHVAVTTMSATLRACAEREERALAGITDEVVRTAWKAAHHPLSEPSGVEMRDMRDSLQSAALALQGDREKLRELVDRWRNDSEVAHKAYMRTAHTHSPDWARHARSEALDDCAADLSRATGDEK